KIAVDGNYVPKDGHSIIPFDRDTNFAILKDLVAKVHKYTMTSVSYRDPTKRFVAKETDLQAALRAVLKRHDYKLSEPPFDDFGRFETFPKSTGRKLLEDSIVEETILEGETRGSGSSKSTLNVRARGKYRREGLKFRDDYLDWP